MAAQPARLCRGRLGESGDRLVPGPSAIRAPPGRAGSIVARREAHRLLEQGRDGQPGLHARRAPGHGRSADRGRQRPATFSSASTSGASHKTEHLPEARMVGFAAAAARREAARLPLPQRQAPGIGGVGIGHQFEHRASSAARALRPLPARGRAPAAAPDREAIGRRRAPVGRARTHLRGAKAPEITGPPPRRPDRSPPSSRRPRRARRRRRPGCQMSTIRITRS